MSVDQLTRESIDTDHEEFMAVIGSMRLKADAIAARMQHLLNGASREVYHADAHMVEAFRYRHDLPFLEPQATTRAICLFSIGEKLPQITVHDGTACFARLDKHYGQSFALITLVTPERIARELSLHRTTRLRRVGNGLTEARRRAFAEQDKYVVI